MGVKVEGMFHYQAVSTLLHLPVSILVEKLSQKSVHFVQQTTMVYTMYIIPYTTAEFAAEILLLKIGDHQVGFKG